MSWRAPTTSDLESGILDGELTGLQAASAPAGKDIAADAITEAVGYFRTALLSGGKVSMGPAGTLPEEVISKAMHYAVYTFLSRVGGAISDSRTKLFSSAETYRNRIAEGKELLAEPGTSDVATTGILPKTRHRPSQLDRRHQEGL